MVITVEEWDIPFHLDPEAWIEALRRAAVPEVENLRGEDRGQRAEVSPKFALTPTLSPRRGGGGGRCVGGSVVRCFRLISDF
jgi:hypothetical protein